MKNFVILSLLLVAGIFAPKPAMAAANVTTAAKYQLNNWMGPVALKNQLGTMMLGLDTNPYIYSYADTTVTTAQVLALNGTPITLVAAPGAGFVTLVKAVYASITYNSVAYACNAAGLPVRYTDGSGTITATLTQGFCQSSASALQYVPAATTALTPVANAAIVLHAGSANPTTGNSAIKVRVFYTTVPSPLP